MPEKEGPERPFYWSVDMPGLTEDGARAVVAWVRGGGPVVELASAVSPAEALVIMAGRELVAALI